MSEQVPAQQGSAHTGGRVYTNAALTVIGAALVMLVAHDTIGLPGLAEARAERQIAARTSESPALGVPNAAEQRVRMIAALERMDDRLSRIEGRLSGRAIDVKVIEMPEIKVSQ